MVGESQAVWNDLSSQCESASDTQADGRSGRALSCQGGSMGGGNRAGSMVRFVL